MTDTPTQPPGWYYAQGDPPGTQRYWDGSQWQGGPQAVPAEGGAASYGTQAGTAGLATPVSRLLARIIDGLILLIPLLIVSLVIGGGLYGLGGGDASFGASLISGVVTTFIGVAYEYYFLSKDGATPGKKTMNIKVVLEDGSELGQDGAMRRLILAALGAIPILGGIVAFFVFIGTAIMIFTDSRRQVPSDKIAKSIVVSTK